MKTALIFTGQGSQVAGMGKDLYENYEIFSSLIDRADQLVDFDLKDIMFNADEAILSQTEYIQPILAAYGMGIYSILKEEGLSFDYMAGLSLGEYSALAAAEAIDFDELIKLTAFRGKAMAKAGAGFNTKMAAVLALDSEITDKICKEISEKLGKKVSISNYNSAGQDVISGDEEAVDEAIKLLTEAGARKCIPLKTSSAFHTSFMEDASKELADYFKGITFKEMKSPVIFNLTAKELQEGETIASLLEEQVKKPVRMRQTIEKLAADGVDKVIEIGPGKTIAGFMKRTAKEIEVLSVENPETLEKAKTFLSE